MWSAAAVTEELASTRVQLDAACDLLLSPTAEAVDRCSALLETAGRRMAAFRGELSEAQGDPEAIEEGWRLRRSFQRAARLMENAARFHERWSATRGTLTGGYLRGGDPAPVLHPGRICMEA